MFKPEKPSLWARITGRSNKERNIAVDPALEGVSERLKRVACTPLEPASDSFKATLLAKLKEARRVNPATSMNSKLIMWFDQLGHSRRFQAAVAFVLIIAITATTVHYWPGHSFGELIISPAYAQDNFTVTPTSSDTLGVDTATKFVIKSKTPIKATDLEKNITVIPALQYKIDRVSDNEFNLVPQEPLQAKAVYKIYITSSYATQTGATQERNYSWAFQVKNGFKILGTLPRDQATDVPRNSGIEITLTSDAVNNFEKHFSISPKVDGRFEHHGRVWVFVPRELAAGTIYTVTVDSALAPSGSSEHLPANYVFTFETEDPNRAHNSYSDNIIKPINVMMEFPTTIAPAIQVYNYSGKNDSSDLTPSVNVEAFRFAGVSSFIDALKTLDAIPSWSNARVDARVPTAGLAKAASFGAPIQSYGYSFFVVFPQTLPAGFYVVNMSNNGDTSQVLLQVTDLSAYITETDTKTLVWVNDLQTKNSVPNATVSVVGTNASANTDAQGIATLDTKTALGVANAAKEGRYLTVANNTGSLVLSPRSINASDWNKGPNDSLVNYTYTDRSLYKPNDTINVWGVAIDKGPAKAATATIQLAGDSYDLWGDPIILAAQTVTIQKDGSYTGTLTLKNVQPGYYSITVSIRGQAVRTNSIEVDAYTKPAYDLKITPDKQAIYAGDTMSFTVQSNFFDGTPVGKLSLNYTVGDTSGAVVTDDQGKARFSVPTSFEQCTDSRCPYPTSIGATVRPTLGEEGEITDSVDVREFGAAIETQSAFTQNAGNDAVVKVTVHNVNLAKINSGTEPLYGEYYGSLAAGVPVNGDIIQIIYTARETGQYYNFIEKKTYKTYSYDTEERSVGSFNGVTDQNGNFEYHIITEKEKSYRVQVRATDKNGRLSPAESYLYTAYREYDDDEAGGYYNIKVDSNTTTRAMPVFKIGETVNTHFQKNDATVATGQGNFLYYTMRQGLQDYKVQTSPDYSFSFKQNYVPSVYLRGVWFDGKVYHKAMVGTYYDSSIHFDTSQRNLTISVTTDKASYQPGEKVTLKAKVADPSGNPVAAALNFNLVDEAFYKLSYDVADPLAGIYPLVDSGML